MHITRTIHVLITIITILSSNNQNTEQVKTNIDIENDL